MGCVAVALALAGCAGGDKASTTTSSSEAPAAVYTVHLVGASGRPRPAPKATGLAIISLYPSREALCWTISQLKDVTTPVSVRIRGHTRNSFLTAGLGRYATVGCRPSTPMSFFRLIEAHPRNFEVVVPMEPRGGPLQGKL